MKTIIIIITILFTTNAYALRIESPPEFTNLADTNQLTQLNNYLTKLQTLVNGKYNNDVLSQAPDWVANEGDMVTFSSGGTYRIYIYLNGDWRIWTSD